MVGLAADLRPVGLAGAHLRPVGLAADLLPVGLAAADLRPVDMVDLPVVDLLPAVMVMALLPEGLADRPKVGLADLPDLVDMDLRKVDSVDLRWGRRWADLNRPKRSPIPA